MGVKEKTPENSAEGSFVEMSRKEFQSWEHEVQTGIRDTLPDGRKISDVQKENVRLQLEQEKVYGKKTDSVEENISEDSAEPSKKVSVSISATGAMSARPAVEATEEQPKADHGREIQSDLPEDFPGRKALIAADVSLLEKVAKLDLDGLKAIPGIGDATAEAIINFGKE